MNVLVYIVSQIDNLEWRPRAPSWADYTHSTSIEVLAG